MPLPGITGAQSIAVGTTATGAGSTVDPGIACTTWTAVCTAATSTSGGVYRLELSQDGVNWYTGTAAITLTTAGVTLSSATGSAWRYGRANITTTVTGGTVGITILAA